jgi:glutamyl-tRNA synthetase
MVRTRFAPSPTGYLHLGGLRTALYTYLYARKMGGKFILRIEDTDQEREVPGAVERIYSSMRLAGLEYDEGPDVGGDYGPYIQTQRRDIYPKYARMLVERGGAYHCFCTKERLDEARAQAEKRGETYKYDKRCLSLPREEAARRVAAGEPYVIRQNVPLEGEAGFDDALYGRVTVACSTLDDNVLIKADGLPTYNFANVVDDHLMGITHVTRGTEYLSSAPKYNLLYEAFGWTPPVYVHLPVVMRDATRKLSKRYGDPSFEDLLDQGYLKEAILNFLALLGWSPRSEREFFTLKELEECFDLEGLNKAPSTFDTAKLRWFNAEYMRKTPPETFERLASPWLAKALDPEKFDFGRILQLLHGRTEVLSDIPEMVGFLREMPDFGLELYNHKKMKCDAATALTVLKQMLPVVENVAPWTEAALHDALMSAIAQSGRKNGQVLWPLRVALSGRASTPGGAIEIAYLLGKEETLSRLARAIGRLESA